MAYPTDLDDFTPKVDNTDDVMANDVNELQTAIESLEAQIGVNDSAKLKSGNIPTPIPPARAAPMDVASANKAGRTIGFS